jgi:hypothetical protein
MILGNPDILEIPTLPRSRDELNSMISVARHERRNGKLTRFAAVNIVVWALYAMFIWGPSQHTTPVQARTGVSVYIPVVTRK